MRSLPHVIAGVVLAGLIGAVALIAGASQAEGPGMVQAVHQQLEEARAAAQLSPLEIDPALTDIARRHAETLAETGLLHVDDAYVQPGLAAARAMSVVRAGDLGAALQLLADDPADAARVADRAMGAVGIGLDVDASGQVYVVLAYRGA